MKAEELRDQLLRSEGYAEGFRAGYASCMKWVSEYLQKETDVILDEKKKE